MLTIILTTMVTVTLTAMFSLGAWAIKRLIDNAKEESVRTRTELTAHMGKLEAKMDARMAKIEESVAVLRNDHSRLEGKLDGVLISLPQDHTQQPNQATQTSANQATPAQPAPAD